MRLVALLLFVLALPLRAQSVVWEPTEGPVGGDVTHVGRGPGGALYALAGRSRHAFRSHDDGATWTRAPGEGVGSEVGAFAVAPDGALLAVGPVYCNTECFHDGAWRSDDDGTTWTAMSLLPDEAVRVVAAGEAAVLASGTLLQRSTDGGATWVPAGITGTWGRLATAPGGFAVALDDDTVYRSTDDGATWAPSVYPGSPAVSRLALASDGTVYGLGLIRDTLYRLPPGATTWEPLGLPTEEYVTALAVGPADALLIGTREGTFRSTNDGETWNSLAVPPGWTYGFSATAGGRLVVGNEWGLWVESAGGTFEQRALAAAAVTELAWGSGPPSGPLLVAGTQHDGVYVTHDHGQTWEASLLPGGAVSVDVGPEGAVWVAVIGGLYRSVDGGAAWETLPRSGALGALVVAPDGAAFVGYFGALPANEGVFRSADGGQAWEYVGLEGEPVAQLAVSPDGTLYATTPDALRRWEGGTSWRTLRSGAYYAAPGTDGLLLAASGGSILRSADRGLTWETAYAGAVDVQGLVLHGAYAVARTAKGSLASVDAGTTWGSFSDASPPDWDVPGALALDGSGRAYAGTYGASVFRTSGAVTAAEGAPYAQSVGTLSIHPNPLRDAGVVMLTLPEAGGVSVALFNVLGRRVALLHDGRLGAGEHALPFDARGLPPGVYVVRIASGGASAARTVTVLR